MADSTSFQEDAVSGGGADDDKWAKNGYGNIVQKSTGKFSKEESELVRKAVQEFCAHKQVSVSRLCSECDHKADLKGAWMEIAKRLPHRSVQSVYRHGLRQLHPFKRGAWTEDECELLVELVARMGKKWVAIQNKLNRSSDSCRDKYREMGDAYIRGRWKEHETKRFVQLIRDQFKVATNVTVQDLHRMAKAEGWVIPFGIISKKMEKRSRLSCYKKWQKMTNVLNQNSSSPSPPAPSTAATYKKTSDELPSIDHQVPQDDQDIVIKRPVNSSQPVVMDTDDKDIALLTAIMDMNVSRETEVDWDELNVPNAQERFHEMYEEWQETQNDDSLTSLPLSEIAQCILGKRLGSGETLPV